MNDWSHLPTDYKDNRVAYDIVWNDIITERPPLWDCVASMEFNGLLFKHFGQSFDSPEVAMQLAFRNMLDNVYNGEYERVVI